MTKYSQPLELIPFHVINPCIKCHKVSHYPHLLNNYLIFPGLTKLASIFSLNLTRNIL